jgi:hypothetical protein
MRTVPNEQFQTKIKNEHIASVQGLVALFNLLATYTALAFEVKKTLFVGVPVNFVETTLNTSRPVLHAEFFKVRLEKTLRIGPKRIINMWYGEARREQRLHRFFPLGLTVLNRIPPTLIIDEIIQFNGFVRSNSHLIHGSFISQPKVQIKPGQYQNVRASKPPITRRTYFLSLDFKMM